MTRAGRSFSVVDAGELAVNSKPGMSLAEIEQWIGEFIKPKPKRVTAAMWVGLKNKSSGQGVASLPTSAYFDARPIKHCLLAG